MTLATQNLNATIGTYLRDPDNIAKLDRLSGNKRLQAFSAIYNDANLAILDTIDLADYRGLADDEERSFVLTLNGIADDQVAPVLRQLTMALRLLTPRPVVDVSVDVAAAAVTSAPVKPSGRPSAFSRIGAANRRATQVSFRLSAVETFKNVVIALGPESAQLDDILFQGVSNEGLRFVRTQKWLSSLLNRWRMARRTWGQVDIPAIDELGLEEGLTVTLVPPIERVKVAEQVLQMLADSGLDPVLVAAYRYFAHMRKNRMMTNIKVQGTSDLGDVPDPTMVQQQLERALAAITTLIDDNVVEDTATMLAEEQAFIVLPALSSPEVVSSLGVTVMADEDALNRFLTYPRNPHKAAVDALRVSSGLEQVMDTLLTYDPQGDFEAFLLILGESASDYIQAVPALLSHSSVKPSVAGPYGLSQAAASVSAMVRVRIKTADGSTIEVTAAASAAVQQTTPFGVTPYAGDPRDRLQLFAYLKDHFSESKLRDLCLVLNVDYENIRAQTWVDKSRELILDLERENRATMSGLVRLATALGWKAAPGAIPGTSKTKAALLQEMSEAFNPSDLEQLAYFEFDFRLEDVMNVHQPRMQLIIAFFEYLQQQGRLEELVPALKKVRERRTWDR